MSSIANGRGRGFGQSRKHQGKKQRRLGERESPPKHGPKLGVEGLTAAELGARVGVGARTVRFYLAERLLPPAVFRGRATRYLREHLLRLAAIRELQRTERLALPALRRRLAALPGGALEQLAEAFLREQGPASTASVAQPHIAAPAPAPTGSVAARWQRFTLLPGLELHLSADAGPRALRIANELAAPFVEPASASAAQAGTPV